MSAETIIKDRPLPFDVKTLIFQLVGMAVGSPNQVADMAVKVDTIINCSVNVRIYPGGYRGDTTAFDETVYLGNKTEAKAVEELNDLIAKANAVLATGRKIRLAAIQKQAADLMAEAAEIEKTISSAQPENTPVA